MRRIVIHMNPMPATTRGSANSRSRTSSDNSVNNWHTNSSWRRQPGNKDSERYRRGSWKKHVVTESRNSNCSTPSPWKGTTSTGHKLCAMKVPWPFCQHTYSALTNLRPRYPMGKMPSAQTRRFARSIQPLRVYARVKFLLWTRRASRILCVMETSTLLPSRQMRKVS